MNRLAIPAIAALFALAACNQTPAAPVVVDTNPDPMAKQLANKPAIELPPAIKADKALRCKDNSLVYVTFYEGDKQAIVRTVKDGMPTRLTAANAGDPLTADGGWKVTGTPNSISFTQPGKGTQSCKS